MIRVRLLLAVLLCAGCAQTVPPANRLALTDPDIQAVFTVQAGAHAIARAITKARTCPMLEVEGLPATPMAVRAEPRFVPYRGDSKLDNKPAVFDVLTCEAELPRNLAPGTARIAGYPVPVPKAEVDTIVIVGDSGCRMIFSGNFLQDCDHSGSWPFQKISGLAAALKPDLVIHVGDYHYRENPCPPGRTECENSPLGYGYDTWNADLFQPARALLAAAPWVFVRGNHESCFRAGQGWFRFVAPEAWSEARSCNDPKLDAGADYTDPYAVPLVLGGKIDTQLIVFDSSRTQDKAFDPAGAPYRKYFEELQIVDRLASSAPHNFFLSHHPILAFAPKLLGGVPYGGNLGLQSVMSTLHPHTLFGPGIDAGLHGHVHLFEALSFSSGQPATFVLGNSGSYRDVSLPDPLPAGLEPAPGAVVKEFSTRSDFGFASLQRKGDSWLLTEWDMQGKAVLHCTLHGNTSHCVAVAIP